MRRCTRCAMPDTRPHSVFDAEGVCLACRNREKQKSVDWAARYTELETLCDERRRSGGYYDCVVPVSGGKDSHAQVYWLKERMKMNPLLVCVSDPFTHSKAGEHNLRNLGEAFNCDTFMYSMSPDLFRRATKIGFEVLGEPLKYIESAIYTVPYKLAVALNIPLVVYGENNAYVYGTTGEDTWDGSVHVASGQSAHKTALKESITDFWVRNGLRLEELNAIVPPNEADVARTHPQVIFLGYFVPWDDERNVEVAKRYGFQDLHHEWQREGCVEGYAQIDSLGYMVHIWMKYPKFGFQRVTDITSRWVRKGLISRDEAMRLVEEHDPKLDQRSLEDFAGFLGYSTRQFWDVVDKFWNRELFEKGADGIWRPREGAL